jgi:hypothetical protein
MTKKRGKGEKRSRTRPGKDAAHSTSYGKPPPAPLDAQWVLDAFEDDPLGEAQQQVSSKTHQISNLVCHHYHLHHIYII